MKINCTSICVALTALVLSVSCKIENTEYEKIDEQTKAIKLLNKGDADNAITIYEEIIESEPENIDAKIELASSYAYKGNVNISSLFPILEIELFNQPVIDWGSKSFRNNPFKEAIDHKIIFQDEPETSIFFGTDARKEFLKKLVKLSWAVYELTPIIALVPLVAKEKRKFLDKAIALLSEIPANHERSQEVAQYQVLLSAVLLVNHFKEIFPYIETDYEQESLCNMKLDQLQSNIHPLIRNSLILESNLAKAQLKGNDIGKTKEVLVNLQSSMENGIFKSVSPFFEELRDLVCI